MNNIQFKSLHARTEEQVNSLIELTKDIEFFSKLPADLHRSCCEVMHIEQFDKDQVIFNWGTVGHSFYIVLSGNVNVYVPKSLSEEGLEDMQFVGEVSAGQGFGERSLLVNRPRAATIIAKDRVVTAVLDKTNYQSLLYKRGELNMNLKVSFLKNLPMFSAWTKLGLSRISYFFKKMECIKNQVLYRQGEESSFIYFVINGDFLVSEKIVRETDTLISRNSSRTREVVNDPTLNFKNCKVVNKQEKALLAVKGKGEVIGYEEIFEGIPFRNNSCECISFVGSLYYIHREV